MACGIAGFVGNSDTNLLRRMSDVLIHRGPDDSGAYEDGNVSLACRRLSIIDLKTGKQPIGNETGSVQVVFNGEIYNYVELGQELEALGHKFSTESDTETVVHAYEEWGYSFLNRLRGMYAFALWDSDKRQLLLARDRFGKKPLYFSLLDGTLLFASEIKSLLQHELLPRRINEDALPFFFQFHYIPSPLTIFKGIESLAPGSYLLYRNDKFKVTPYWDMAFNEDLQTTEESWMSLLYESLFDAVRVRLRSDVPLGAFLSGGIDSSGIAAMMQRALGGSLKTFTVGFHEESYDESKFARVVADHIGSEHHESTVEPDALKVLPKLVWHYDQPFADPSMIPTYYVSQIARRRVTVALSGDGGDEMFMGYRFLTDPPVYKYYVKVPRTIRRGILTLLASLPTRNEYVQMASAAKRLGYDDQSPEYRYLLRVAYSGLDIERCFANEMQNKTARSKVQEYLLQKFAQAGQTNFLNSSSYVTIKTYLSEGILVKVDRASMANSLEVRCPFLDSRVASLVARIPNNLRLQEGETKYIFKRMLRKYDLLPKTIVSREKHGFGPPIDFWFQGEWRNSAQQILENNKAIYDYVDRNYVLRLLAQPDLNAVSLYALVCFALWHKMFIEDMASSFHEARQENYVNG